MRVSEEDRMVKVIRWIPELNGWIFHRRLKYKKAKRFLRPGYILEFI